jgi:hypothetical protein
MGYLTKMNGNFFVAKKRNPTRQNVGLRYRALLDKPARPTP